MYNFTLKVVVFTSIALAVYSSIVLFKISKNTLKTPPRVFVLLNDIYSSIPSVNVFLMFLKKAYFLMFLDKIKGEILSVITVTAYPLVFLLSYCFLSNFTDIWYLNVLNLLVCSVFPLLLIKSFVIDGCRKIQMRMIKLYSSFAVLLTQNRAEEALTEIIRTSSGKEKIIALKIKELFLTDKALAYDYLITTIGDNYTESVVYNLIQYEEYGTIPTEEILRICSYALEMDKINNLRRSKLGAAKISCILIAIINIIINWFTNQMVTNLGGSFNNNFLLYASLFICFISLLACFIFEYN